jgi:hypothetical protein
MQPPSYVKYERSQSSTCGPIAFSWLRKVGHWPESKKYSCVLDFMGVSLERHLSRDNGPAVNERFLARNSGIDARNRTLAVGNSSVAIRSLQRAART